MWEDFVLERETICVHFTFTDFVKYFQSYTHNKNLFKIFFKEKNVHTCIPEEKS